MGGTSSLEWWSWPNLSFTILNKQYIANRKEQASVQFSAYVLNTCLLTIIINYDAAN